jgi:hypothetical protein
VSSFDNFSKFVYQVLGMVVDLSSKSGKFHISERELLMMLCLF